MTLNNAWSHHEHHKLPPNCPEPSRARKADFRQNLDLPALQQPRRQQGV